MDIQTVTSQLLNSLKRNADRTAITFFRQGEKETELAFEDLDRDSTKLASVFASYGLAKGDRVVFSLPKSLFFVVAYMAVLRLGAIAVPCNPELTKTEKEYLLNDALPKLILTGSKDHGLFREIATDSQVLAVDEQRSYQELVPEIFAGPTRTSVETDPDLDDPALIIYTSGTTGLPKGAILTQANLGHDSLKIIKAWEITANDRILHALPLFHVHGLSFALTACLLAGASVFMLDRFKPEEVLGFLTRKGKDRSTVFMAVPTMYTRLLDCLQDEGQASFDHIRLLTSGSAPLNPNDFKRIQDSFGKPPVEREGMSETGMNFSNPVHGPKKRGSIGLPLPGVEVRIVDPESLVEVGRGCIGEIWLKGPSVTPRYWNKPKETAKNFYQGWFRSGDLGWFDEDGYYFLTDRLKHIIISGGENISPKEIENRLNQHQAVLESAAFGVQDRQWGERVAAAVVLDPAAKAEAKELKDYCRQYLHKWKCPKEIYILNQLPRNTMGKILKHELQQLANQD